MEPFKAVWKYDDSVFQVSLEPNYSKTIKTFGFLVKKKYKEGRISISALAYVFQPPQKPENNFENKNKKKPYTGASIIYIRPKFRHYT